MHDILVTLGTFAVILPLAYVLASYFEYKIHGGGN